VLAWLWQHTPERGLSVAAGTAEHGAVAASVSRALHEILVPPRNITKNRSCLYTGVSHNLYKSSELRDCAAGPRKSIVAV
jgi:hypothetical protein